MNFGPEASKLFATGLFTMPKLRSAELIEMEFHNNFFLVMAELGRVSQVHIKRWMYSLYTTYVHGATSNTQIPKYIFFLSKFYFPVDMCINSVKETCFSHQKYQKWIYQVLEINSSILTNKTSIGMQINRR